MRKTVAIYVAFGTVWSAVVIAFFTVPGPKLAEQVLAGSYASTTGVMTHAEVARDHSGGDGGPPTVVYGPSLEYRYTVDGVEYTGTRYQAINIHDQNRSRAEAIVREHQPGTEVTVYYDPGNPQTSVLNREVDGLWWFLVMFAMPFLGTMIAFWWAGAVSLWHRLARPAAAGVVLKRDAGRISACVAGQPLVFVGILWGCLTALPLTIAIGFTAAVTDPPILLVQLAFLGILAGGGLGALWAWWMNRNGHAWLIIDPAAQQITVPAIGDRKEPLTLPVHAVSSISVMPIHDIEKRTGLFWEQPPPWPRMWHQYDRGPSSVDTYGVVLNVGQQLVPAAFFLLQFRAEDFARWMSDRTGRPVDGASPAGQAFMTG